MNVREKMARAICESYYFGGSLSRIDKEIIEGSVNSHWDEYLPLADAAINALIEAGFIKPNCATMLRQLQEEK